MLVIVNVMAGAGVGPPPLVVKTLCELGAKMVLLARKEPGFFYGGDENDVNESIEKQQAVGELAACAYEERK